MVMFWNMFWSENYLVDSFRWLENFKRHSYEEWYLGVHRTSQSRYSFSFSSNKSSEKKTRQTAKNVERLERPGTKCKNLGYGKQFRNYMCDCLIVRSIEGNSNYHLLYPSLCTSCCYVTRSQTSTQKMKKDWKKGAVYCWCACRWRGREATVTLYRV